jgi:hypothetical protein
MHEPNDAKCATEIPQPRRESERIDNDEPHCKYDRSDAASVIFTLPIIDIPEPTRPKLRMDMEEPSTAKSKKDMAEPNFPKDLRDILDPM